MLGDTCVVVCTDDEDLDRTSEGKSQHRTQLNCSYVRYRDCFVSSVSWSAVL